MMTWINVMFFLTLCLISCKSQGKWKGGKIVEEGIYENERVKIIVTDNDDKINFYMLDSKKDTLLRANRTFNPYQRWALHLDKDENLWVFSSDIGDFCWKRDSTSGKYIEKEILGLFSKDSISSDVWETVKEFPLSIKK